MATTIDSFRAPEAFSTDEFKLRPIRAADAELDYEAVMESRDLLRVWEQSTWPEDDFTVAANREDLAKLERRHEAGESFTYTVMNLDQTTCLGCVYITPTAGRYYADARISAVGDAQWSEYDDVVFFWVRKSRVADGLDRRLLDAIGSWFARDWQERRHLIVTTEAFGQQVATIAAAGMHLTFRIQRSNEPGTTLAYTGA